MLSGECRFYREFWKRGNYKVTRAFQECIRRRAVTSMVGRSAIKDQEEAEKYVDSVWESCFRDTRPFDEIYK
jgi:mitochondrial inner membrane protease ATP23